MHARHIHPHTEEAALQATGPFLLCLMAALIIAIGAALSQG